MVVAILFLDYSTSEGYIDTILYDNECACQWNNEAVLIPPPHMHTHRPLAMVAMDEGHGCHHPKSSLPQGFIWAIRE